MTSVALCVAGRKAICVDLQERRWRSSRTVAPSPSSSGVFVPQRVHDAVSCNDKKYQNLTYTQVVAIVHWLTDG